MSAMYYLSRGGAPEGPFEEARLVYMIQSGELTAGGACLVGQSQWLALNVFPVFAQAFAARAAASGYGAPAPGNYGAAAPTVHGHSSDQPVGAGYAAPPAAAGYGAPQPLPAQAAPGVPAAGKKQAGRGLLIALVAGVLLLVVAGTAVGAYLIFFSSGGARSIAQSVPRDCELLVEVPSLRKLVLDLHGVQFLDTSLRDDKQVFDDASDAVAKGFELSPSDATSLLTAAETFGVSARKLEATPEVVLALGMRSAAPVEALLKSARFTAAGAVGLNGRRYLLTRKPLQPSAGQSPVLKALAGTEVGASDKAVLVWFPTQKVLALGSAPLVADLAKVIESGAASITQNPAYQAAKKDFDSGSRLTAFIDPGALAGQGNAKLKQLVDEYFTPAGPLTGSLRVGSAGFVSSFIGHVSGSKLPREGSYEPPQALDLSDRLPAETFGYVAASTRSKLTGAEVEALLLDQVGSIDARTRASAEQGLRELERVLGVSASKLIDGIGGQAVLGVAASTDLALAQLNQGPAAAANFNLTWIQELKDDTEFKQLAAQLKQKLLPGLREAVVTDDGLGFSLTPRGTPLPLGLRVKFLDKHLFVTAGGNALCDRAEAAFSKGERALKEDAAHKAALAALPASEHVRIWIDTGRMLDGLRKNSLIAARLAEQGLPLDKITLNGPNRVVSALSLRAEVQNEVWSYRVDALNVQALAMLGAGAGTAALGALPGLRGL